MKKITQIEIRQIIQEEIENIQNEGLGSFAKAAALATGFPGARFISDYSRAQGFSDVESSLNHLAGRVTSLEKAIDALSGVTADAGMADATASDEDLSG